MSGWWSVAAWGVVLAAWMAISALLGLRRPKVRPEADPDEYIRHLTREGVPRSVAEIVRAYLQDRQGIPDFPVLATDGLEVYELDDGDELEDTVFELAELCGRRDRPAGAELAGACFATVEDLAKEVARIAATDTGQPARPIRRIDRVARDQLALSLRRFLTGRITNLELAQDIRALRWMRADRAIPGVLRDLEAALDAHFERDLLEGAEYRFPERYPLTRERTRELVRLAAFLYADRPYRWRLKTFAPARGAASIAIVLLVCASLARFGHPWLATLSVVVATSVAYLSRKWEDRERRRAHASVYYPFASAVDLASARWRPRLFRGYSR